LCPNCKQEIGEQVRFCPYCGAATPLEAGPPGDPYVGQTINSKFYIQELLGQGGMGRVYKAMHLTLDRPVVLKMLHKTFLSDASVVQRFQREAKAASRLNHANSIQVIDFGQTEDGTLFMAMEYLPGRDLSKLLSQEFPLGELRVIRIVSQILSALAEAHAHGVIHRDLKPENVMVEPRRDEPDFVKVLDFGIAKISGPEHSSEPKLTRAGLVCGTPEYMSPEQARGEELDARSDLYSVGVILYQLVTGTLPFDADTPIGFVTKHLTETPPAPRERRPDLPISPALDQLIVRCLSKDKSHRPPHADQMRAELLACVNSQPVAAKPLAGPRDTSMSMAGPTAPVTPRFDEPPTNPGAVMPASVRRPPPPPAQTFTGVSTAADGKRPGAVATAVEPNRHAEGSEPLVLAGQRKGLPLAALAIAVLLVAAGGAIWFFRYRDAGKQPDLLPDPKVASAELRVPEGTKAPEGPKAPEGAPDPVKADPPRPDAPKVETQPDPEKPDQTTVATRDPPKPDLPKADPVKPEAKNPAKDPGKEAKAVKVAVVPVKRGPPDREKAMSLYEEAQAAQSGEKWGQAIRLYLAAENADPSLFQVHKKLGLCYQATGDKKRATTQYKKYLESSPGDADAVRAILADLQR
jgi:serine/threonine-protein kinase